MSFLEADTHSKKYKLNDKLNIVKSKGTLIISDMI
jgi:hypothetical protein